MSSLSLSIFLSYSSSCSSPLSLLLSRQERTRARHHHLHTCYIRLPPSKALSRGGGYRLPSWTPRALGTGFCDAQSGAAKNKISTFSLPLFFSPSSSFPSVLQSFHLSAFFRLSIPLASYSLRPRSAPNTSLSVPLIAPRGPSKEGERGSPVRDVYAIDRRRSIRRSPRRRALYR